MKFLTELWGKIKWRWKLKRMDDRWYMLGGNCFGLHPPSFYYKHSPEEARRIVNEEIECLRKMMDELE